MTESSHPASVPAPPRRSTRPPAGVKLRDADKLRFIPLRPEESTPLRKPDWLRIRAGGNAKVARIKSILRAHRLHTVCEEASCPNLTECFSGGTATFMIMGEICTRRCPFCDVGHGKPLPLDPNEPTQLAAAIAELQLNYVVITSVDRDDLRDGGAAHFAACIRAIRAQVPGIQIEILTPDFRGRQPPALEILSRTPPDLFNHNLETVPRLYRQARPGANYAESLALLQQYKQRNPAVPTKSGLMAGLGETREELLRTFADLRAHGVEMLTLGQYLQPSKAHYPVQRYLHPDEFAQYAAEARALGFTQVAAGPLVRSSYHADQQASGFTTRDRINNAKPKNQAS
ncbi:MAG: lipoyl synthase [Cellvibrionales bacterium]|nr:lipoyl synthase [Cellvibrionales bacterium]